MSEWSDDACAAFRRVVARSGGMLRAMAVDAEAGV